jgi:hypothetical protein
MLLFFFVSLSVAVGSVTAEPRPTTIGVILPLTGDAAGLGEATKNGITMALEELPPEERKRIRVLYQDDAFRPSQTVAAFESMLQANTLDAVINISSGTALALAPVAGAVKMTLPPFTGSGLPCHGAAVTVAASGWVAVGQIGDGAVVGRWPDGRLETLSLPQRGEYANETTPLTADAALENLRVTVWPRPIQALALFSDGLQALALDLASGAPHAPFFAPFLAALAEPLDPDAIGARLADFLDSPRVCARTDDDKTLLVAGNGPPG